jgi:hypothetical protein
MVWDLVEDGFDGDDLFTSDVEAFDGLQPSQKLAVLALVGQALSDERTPAPELTDVTEGTVAAVFACIREAVLLEVETFGSPEGREQPPGWRERVLAAAREGNDDWEGPLRRDTCRS